MSKLTELLSRNLSSIFNERNDRKRRAALKELWAVDGVLWTAEGTYQGYKNIDRAANALLRRYPEFDFALTTKADEIPDAVRGRWSFGALGTPPAITGMDVVVIADGRIVAMYRFLDGAGL